MVDTRHYAFVKTHRMYNTNCEPMVNCGLELLIMCQYWFIHCSQYAIIRKTGASGIYKTIYYLFSYSVNLKVYLPETKSLHYHEVQISGEFLRPSVLSYAPF